MQGELDFESALRERVGLLAGLEESAIADLPRRADRADGRARARWWRRSSTTAAARCWSPAASTTSPIRWPSRLGFERVVANRLAVRERQAQRRARRRDHRIRDGKERVLREELARLGDNAVSLATGDGANDIPMLAAATYGVAYHAKPKARAAANGWVDRGDLTAILKLLGIPERDRPAALTPR